MADPVHIKAVGASSSASAHSIVITADDDAVSDSIPPTPSSDDIAPSPPSSSSSNEKALRISSKNTTKRKRLPKSATSTSKRKRRELTALEIENSLKEAKARGLPDGWTVTYDNKQQRKLWISPYNGKACKSIPEALAQSGIKPFSKTKLSEKERAKALAKGKSKGLPEEWDVSWDSRRRRTIWIAPDGITCCDSIPEALQHSGLARVPKRQLVKEEIAEAMIEAKKRGLPDGWTVSWDNKARRRRWISPDGKIAKGIPEAIAMASQRGLTASEVAAQVNNTDEINSSNPLAMLADVGRLLAMPQQKELSPYEQEQALNKARERGLPEDWSVKCNKWGNKKVWISPQGKICNSIPEALQAAGVTTSKAPTSHSHSNVRTLTKQEMENAMVKARAAGLPEEWRIEPFTRQRQKVFISPQGRRAKGLSGALTMAGVKLSPQDVEATMQAAKERGLLLENGWTVVFDSKYRQKRWISPQGDICDKLPSGEAAATPATVATESAAVQPAIETAPGTPAEETSSSTIDTNATDDQGKE